MNRIRLDKLLAKRKIAPSRERAQALIMSGVIYVNGQREDKAGKQVPDDIEIEIKGNPNPYVSRGGIKLEGALSNLGVNPEGKVCLDVGQSTGGFSDCLLQKGATHVYGVDVGYGQLALKIRNDSRVTVFERSNFRTFDIEQISEPVDMAVIDVSFISLKLILPVAEKCLKPGGLLLAMVKPQFEVGKGQIGSGGVVRDEALQKETVDRIIRFGRDELGLIPEDFCESPITGPKGNREYFCLFKKM